MAFPSLGLPVGALRKACVISGGILFMGRKVLWSPPGSLRGPASSQVMDEMASGLRSRS